MSLRRKIFYSFTIAVVVILLMVPATGWIARIQLIPFVEKPLRLRTMFGRQVATDTTPVCIMQATGDLDAQLAAALTGADRNQQIHRLEILSRAHPSNPVIIATLLQVMSASQIRLHRDSDTNLLYGYSHASTAKPVDAELAAHFVTLAEAGERIDPDNAYFPMMATMGYLAADNDREGIHAWERASQKTKWESYAFYRISAFWKRDQRAGEADSYSARAAYKYVQEYPHISGLIRTAQGVIAQAVQAECAGDEATGFRLRQATRLNGERMLQGKPVQEAMTGYRIAMVAALRPGGALAERNPYDKQEQKAEWNRRQLKMYRSYLLAKKHTEEATAFARIIPNGETLTHLTEEGRDATYDGFGKKTFRFLGIWCVDILLLTGVLFALVFAVIFKLIYRFSPRLQRGEPLQSAARWGVILGLVLPVLATLVVQGIRTEWSNAFELSVAGGILAGLLLMVPPMLLRLSWRSVGHGLLLTLVTIVTLASLLATGMLAWGIFGTALREFWLFAMLLDFAHYSGEEHLFPVLVSCAVITVPLMMLGIFALFSRVLRIPIAAGVTRGMRLTAVPLASVLLLIWSGAVLYTLREERKAVSQLEHIIAVGEPQAFAELLHHPIPNTVR